MIIIVKVISIIFFGLIFYVYRLSKIENTLFRLNDKNRKQLCLGSLYSGLIGPIKSCYLALKYSNMNNFIHTFFNLFLSLDNPLIIFLFFGLFISQI
jgi:hypothetical protein